jgi:hypothetical protein
MDGFGLKLTPLLALGLVIDPNEETRTTFQNPGGEWHKSGKRAEGLNLCNTLLGHWREVFSVSPRRSTSAISSSWIETRRHLERARFHKVDDRTNFFLDRRNILISFVFWHSLH